MIAFASSYRVCTTIDHPPVKLGRGRHSGNMMLAKFLFVLFLFSAVADNAVHINCQGILFVFCAKEIGSVKRICYEVLGQFFPGNSSQYITVQLLLSFQSLH